MVDEDRYCIDVLTQIGAIQAALDKVALGLLDGHARHCLLGEGSGPESAGEQADELMGAVGRLMRRDEIIGSMAVETGLSDIHRLSADEYHRMIESGGLDEDTRDRAHRRAAPGHEPEVAGARARRSRGSIGELSSRARPRSLSSSASARRSRSATPSRSPT